MLIVVVIQKVQNFDDLPHQVLNKSLTLTHVRFSFFRSIGQSFIMERK